MPQFDFATYPSQIFWFGLCFIFLYLFAYSIILPRIKSILNKRYDLINGDKDLAKEISKQFNAINVEAEQNFQNANTQYLNKIDEIVKKTNIERANAIENLKKEIEAQVKNSRQEIKKFVLQANSNNKDIIQNLTKLIKSKIIN